MLFTHTNAGVVKVPRMHSPKGALPENGLNSPLEALCRTAMLIHQSAG